MPRRSLKMFCSKLRETASPGPLSENILDRFAGYAGEPDVQALEFDRQFRVLDAEQSQHRRMEVVDIDRILDGGIPQFVRRAINHPGLGPAAAHPDAEPGVVVIAPVAALAHRGASKF